jgi:hypothetical protein
VGRLWILGFLRGLASIVFGFGLWLLNPIIFSQFLYVPLFSLVFGSFVQNFRIVVATNKIRKIAKPLSGPLIAPVPYNDVGL